MLVGLHHNFLIIVVVRVKVVKLVEPVRYKHIENSQTYQEYQAADIVEEEVLLDPEGNWAEEEEMVEVEVSNIAVVSI